MSTTLKTPDGLKDAECKKGQQSNPPPILSVPVLDIVMPKEKPQDFKDNTMDCRCYDSNGKPLEAAAGKPSESKKPFKKSGGDKGIAFMQSMFKAYAKKQKKAGKSKKHKKRDYDSSDSSDSE